MNIGNKRLIIKPLGGIGNRMRAIDSALSYANQYNFSLTVIWEQNTNELNCPYYKLFKPSAYFEVIETKAQPYFSFSRLHFPQYLNEKNWIYRIANKTHLFENKIIKNAKTFYFDEFTHISEQINKNNPNLSLHAFDNLFCQTINQFLEDNANTQILYLVSFYRFYPSNSPYSSFQLTNAISEKLNQNKFNVINAIGLHIRRTDHERSKAFSTLDKFIHVINSEIQINPHSTFYIATDDDSVLKTLVQSFGNRILSFPKNNTRTTEQGIIDAVTELYLLSETKKIYGSYFSTYNQVAAQIRNKELIIIK